MRYRTDKPFINRHRPKCNVPLSGDRERGVRINIMVRRDSAVASHLIANDVRGILASIGGISAPVIEHQYINRADFSYESDDGGDHLDQIDHMLSERGMYRL